MITEAIQGYFLLGHHLNGRFVDLGIVDPDTAKDGKGLKERDIRFIEGRSIILKDKYGIYVVYILCAMENTHNAHFLTHILQFYSYDSYLGKTY